MKKGDLKKQEILSTAEEMFCKNGYEHTSVQEIIYHINSSKGSFYHHFLSKEAVLTGICSNRARQIFSAAETECKTAGSSVGRLDILLSGMIPFRDEKLQFLLMLLPVFMLPEGRTIRQSYCDALSQQFYTAICCEIINGHNSGELFCNDPENATQFVICLINHLWNQICDIIIKGETKKVLPDLTECLHITECCRICIERFLSLPYGSLIIVDMHMLRNLAEKIHNHWSA